MESIFISHSQYDRAINDFFAMNIENLGLVPIRMEYENWNHENAGIEIRRRIMSPDCNCLIVLIGNRILFPPGYNPSFTHVWVGFEIGVAASAKKPIIVFEEEFDNLNDVVPFPIPYLDHYVRYRQDNESYIRGLLGGKIPLKNNVSANKFTCGWTHCRAEYVYWNIRHDGQRRIEERIPCPSCRQMYRPGIDTYLVKEHDTGPMPSNVV